jgi:AcrR family transcriptional regulator
LKPDPADTGEALPVVTVTVRERVLEGAFACVGRYGLAKTTVDDVARASGVSRATIYRHFPDGREQLVREVVAWEMGRFFRRLGEAVADAPDLVTLVERALVFARQAVLDHTVLQKVLVTEPERLLPLITLQAAWVLRMIAAFLMPFLERERAAGRLRPGIDLESACDYIARMFLSFVNAPASHRLDTAAGAASTARYEILGAVLV